MNPSLTGAPRLDVEGLSTGYGHTPVLRDVSLTVGDEIVAVLGLNGAGKSTLLRAISGMLKPWAGQVRVDGTVITNASSWARVMHGAAHVPEGRHTFGALTVRENLDAAGLVAAKRGAPTWDRQAIYDLFPRLGERESQPAGSLSGGEQQMLVIGRALMTSPRLLLVDEMSAGLAPVTAGLLVAALGRIHAEHGLAMLLVEQSPSLIADLTDRTYFLERGTFRLPVGSAAR